MHKTAKKVLRSVPEGLPWEVKADNSRHGGSFYLEKEERLMLMECKRSQFGNGEGGGVGGSSDSNHDGWRRNDRDGWHQQ
jgi:hypothetical protein